MARVTEQQIRSRELGWNYGNTAAESDIASRPRTRENLTESATNTVWMDLNQMICDEYRDLDATDQEALVEVAMEAARDAWASYLQ